MGECSRVYLQINATGKLESVRFLFIGEHNDQQWKLNQSIQHCEQGLYSNPDKAAEKHPGCDAYANAG